ncbi:MAG TPA: type III-A CRISPR-associated protein Cas10/Csm1, partial [bacterium]|nr:type III-A CRISPR-associated protein Cas10/Csm1 [bacterium]
MDKKQEAVILGGLLHDIGKFYQRAYPDKTNLSQQTKNLEGYICPFNKKGNFFTHQHVLWTNEFFNKYLKGYDDVASIAVYHHRPDKFEDKIVQLADWLSSGERRKREPEETLPVEVKQEPLISIFSQIEINNKKTDIHFCPAVSIGKKIEDLFPCKNKTDALNEKKNFTALWDGFSTEIGHIKPSDGFNKNYPRIQHLLEKYTLFVPSSAYFDKPEVSLFHHLKSSAAIAGCLVNLDISEKDLDDIIETFYIKPSQILQRKDFVLVSGDLSGIQNFIYSVTTKQALKGLRGRSFYLQIVSETIARYILDEFNLPECNLLFLGGGNFTLLLPNTPDFPEKIKNLAKTIGKNMLDLHNGRIISVLGYTTLSYQDFTTENFSRKIEDLRNIMTREKRRKLSPVFEEKNLFKPYPQFIDKELYGCEICGKEIETEGKCSLCSSFENLSKEIRYSKTLEIEHIKYEKEQMPVDSWEQFPSTLGYKYTFKKESLGSRSDKITYIFNNPDFLTGRCDGWRFESIYSPEGTLEDLSKVATGVKKWAALRMDVDNLGLIFSEGLKEKSNGQNKDVQKISISRYSMLSSMVSLFFSIGINHLRETRYQNCCVVYSGGDDLFIIGPWSDIPNFATDIRESFIRYTCNHPGITISGGIFIAPSSGFPVYRAAIEAGQLEEKAKRGEKNKISFLDTSINWQDFY